MTARASFEELFEFANAVRAAGGGNPIDALMPAVPEVSTQCLIAKNLNFNCVVQGDSDGWFMAVDDVEIRDRIADALGLEKLDGIDGEGDLNGEAICYDIGVRLPGPIAQIAKDFDRAMDIAYNIVEEAEWELDRQPATLTPEEIVEFVETHPNDFPAADLALLREMFPYIEEAAREGRHLAYLVTDDGRLVL